MQRINVKVHPTGRVTLGCIPVTDSLIGSEPPPLDDESEWTVKALQVHGGQAVGDSGMSEGSDKFGSTLKFFNNGGESLGLSLPANSLKRGRGGITSRGQNLVKDAVWWLQNQYGKGRLTFLTWTLPDEVIKPELIENWSAFTKLLKEKLQYHLGADGLPKHIVGVTEIQEKRGLVNGLPPLHLHWVFVGRHFKGSWVITPRLADKLFLDALSNWVPCDGVKAAGRLERVKSSVVAYLGKYLSKGRKALMALGITDDVILPSSWYVCTRALARKAKKLVKHYQIDCQFLNPLEIENLVKSLGGFWFNIWVGDEDRSFVVGGVGGVSSSRLGILTQI